jgi:hypothetical protein
MADTYFVRLFERRNQELVASSLIEASDYIEAIGEALRRAQEAAGAIAFARTGDKQSSDESDVQIIIKVGEVPDTLPVPPSPDE